LVSYFPIFLFFLFISPPPCHWLLLVLSPPGIISDENTPGPTSSVLW
jgi:hypothetical protein